MKTETRKKKWLIYLLLVLGSIIMIVPFGWMVIVAFTKPDITYQMTLENVLDSLSVNSFHTLFSGVQCSSLYTEQYYRVCDFHNRADIGMCNVRICVCKD